MALKFKATSQGQTVRLRIEGVEVPHDASPGDTIAVTADLPLGVAAEFERDARRALRSALGETGDIDKAERAGRRRGPAKKARRASSKATRKASRKSATKKGPAKKTARKASRKAARDVTKPGSTRTRRR